MYLKKTIYFIICAVLLFSGCKKHSSDMSTNQTDPGTCVQSAGFGNGDTIQGIYIVAYNTTAVAARGMNEERLQDISAATLSRNNISESAIEENFSGEPGGFVAHLSTDEVNRLRADKSISMIEPDRIIALGTCFTVVAPRLVTWNITRVGYGDGTGKTAWVIDTGIDYDHPDLTVDTVRSKSFLSGNSSARDQNGHGTHVAGIIGAKNNSFGVLGVASGATLVSLRVLDKDGSGTLSAIIQALGYVNSHGSAGDVINLSVGSDDGTSDIMDQQVKNTAVRGIYIAIAAGNDHTLANKSSPARANGPNIFTVSAIDSLDNFASFSDYGNDVVDYAMPGVRILSTYMGGRYAYMSGTSMATPHMAGILLLKGTNFTISGTAKNDPDGVPDPIAHF
jgi:subtilisin